jgi:hypothetical protein
LPQLKKSSTSFGSLYVCIRDCEYINYRLAFFHDDLLHGLDVTDSVAEDIDDLDVLNVRDSVPDIVVMFHIVSEALIILLHDGLESLSNRWMLVRTMEVLNEHGI